MIEFALAVDGMDERTAGNAGAEDRLARCEARGICDAGDRRVAGNCDAGEWELVVLPGRLGLEEL